MCSKYRMSLSLNVLNHLGINLYSNIPAVLSEIVANSWDADSENVYISINKNNEIVISDDGCGMNAQDINDKFLFVGYQKRNSSTESAKFQRKYMGRKGIGKLSMFSIANVVEVYSRKKTEEGYEENALQMNVSDITKKIKEGNTDTQTSSNYYPKVIEYNADIKDTGTKIVLKELKKLTTSLTPDYIRKRVARRFGIIGQENHFSVFINNKEVEIQDRDYFHKLSYIWYYGEESEKYANINPNISHKEVRNNILEVEGKTEKISGWIGAVESAGDLKDEDENLNKIIVLVRGKVGQEDILSDYSEGGLYSKYLIGEINADFFDSDDREDMATSNRQEYRKDDSRFIALRSFIYNELKYIQGKWTELRNETGEKKAKELLPVIGEWMSNLQGDDKEYAKKMFGKVNQIIAEDDKKKEILKYSILAFEKLKYTKHLKAIDTISVENFEVFNNVFNGLDELEATMYYQIIRERIAVIEKFETITDDNALEKVIQQHLFDHLWLLDPAWERVEGTEYMERSVLKALDAEFEGLTEDERKGRLDLGYRTIAGKHVVIELKRAGRVVKTSELINQVMKYKGALEKVLNKILPNNTYSYEILFVVGKAIDNDDSLAARKQLQEMLKPLNTRVLYYNELIENAYNAYGDYIRAHKKSQELVEMFVQLDAN